METKTISKGFFARNIRDFNEDDIIKGFDDNGVAYYNFQADCYDDLIVWMGMAHDHEELKEVLDNCDGSYVAYIYFFEDGRTSIAVEYPYDLEDDTEEYLVDGEGAEEIRNLLKPYIDAYNENEQK